MLCYFGDVTETTKLLDCDTIGQAKKKIIDTLNKNMLASEKPGLFTCLRNCCCDLFVCLCI